MVMGKVTSSAERPMPARMSTSVCLSSTSAIVKCGTEIGTDCYQRYARPRSETTHLRLLLGIHRRLCLLRRQLPARELAALDRLHFFDRRGRLLRGDAHAWEKRALSARGV